MNPRAFFFFVTVLIIAGSGCAKVAHMQELLTLKAYSDEGAVQERYVKIQDEKFEQLLAAMREDAISSGTSKRDFLKKYGDPIYVREVTRDGIVCDEWLYRYALRSFDSDKGYFYFSTDGKLLSWQYVPLEEKKENTNDQRR